MDNASLSSTRTAPRDLAAEKAVLGAAFLSKGAIEEAMEFISEDEMIEITPKSIRMRKAILSNTERMKKIKGRK